jgi:hypothetical protein
MGIVLGRDFYSRGAVKAFIISKGRVMTRGQFQTIDVTEEIKQELLKIFASDRVQEDKLINAIGDLQGDRETIHTNPTNIPRPDQPVTNVDPPSQLDERDRPDTSLTTPALGANETSTNSLQQDSSANTDAPSETITRPTPPAPPVSSRLRPVRSSWRDKSFAYRMSLRVAKKKYPEAAVAAASTELRQLIQRGTIVPVAYAPKDQRVLPSLLNITEKFDASGEFVKMKGRLCAAGNYVDRTTYNHWSEVTSQTVKYESVMTILSAGAYHNAIMGTFDFPGAFLNAKLRKTHYMRLNDQVTEIIIREFPEYRQLVRENGI